MVHDVHWEIGVGVCEARDEFVLEGPVDGVPQVCAAGDYCVYVRLGGGTARV